MAERQATVVLNFTANAEDADKKLSELLEKAARGVVVPVTFEQAQQQGARVGAEAATFGNPNGAAATGNVSQAQARLDSLSEARVTGTTSAATSMGAVGSPMQSAAVQSAAQIVSERATARQTGGEFPTGSVEDIMRRQAAATPNLPPAKALVNYQGENVAPTALDRLHDRMTNSQLAAQANAGFPDAGAYLRQAQRDESAYTDALARSPVPGLDQQKSRALQQQAMDTARADLATRNLDPEQLKAVSIRAQTLQAGNPMLTTGAATTAALQDLRSQANEQNRAAAGLERVQRTFDTADFAKFRNDEKTVSGYVDLKRATVARLNAEDAAAAERAAGGSGTRLGGINSRLDAAGAALAANRGGADEKGYQREYDQLLGEQAIARGDASKPRFSRGSLSNSEYGNLLRRRSEVMEAMKGSIGTDDERGFQTELDSVQGQIQDYKTGQITPLGGRRILGFNTFELGKGAFALDAIGSGVRSVNQFLDLGQNPTGRTSSLAARDALQSYQAGQNLVQGTPIIGSALGAFYDFGSALGNLEDGRGFMTEGTRLQREAALAESRSDAVRANLGAPFEARRAKTFSVREQIAIDAQEQQTVANFDIDQNAALTPEDRAQQKLDAKNRIDRQAAVRVRDFGVSIATGYAGAEVDRSTAAANERRDSVGALYSETIGRSFAVSSTMDPEERQLVEYQGRVQYNAGFSQIQRDNTNAQFDNGYATKVSGLVGSRSFFAAEREQNNDARQAALREAGGGSGDAAVDLASGFTGRVNSINQRFDAMNQAQQQQASFSSQMGSYASFGRLGAVMSANSGQALAGSLSLTENSRLIAQAGLDRTDPNYARNAETVNRNAQAQSAASSGQFIMANTQAAIGLQGAARASNLATSGYSYLAAREQVNTQYAQSMTGFDWGVTNDPNTGRQTRDAALARYSGVYSQFQTGQRDARIGEARNQISAQTAFAGNSFQLADRPLDGQLAGIAGRFAGQTAGMDPNSIDYKRARGVAESEIAAARQANANETKLIDIGQKYSGRALDRQGAQDPVGAQAAMIAGAGLQQANTLAMGGRPEQAEIARQQTIKQLDNLKKDYGLSFTGQEFDLQNIAINNARDAQNPAEVFAQIAGNRADVSTASLGSDAGAGGAIGDKLAAAIGSLSKGATLDDIVAAVQALTPEN